MFLVNSRLGRFIATSSGSLCETVHLGEALLLPKLRSHFAEFLNEGSLERLGILYLPTCVGFSTDAACSGQRLFLPVWDRSVRRRSSSPSPLEVSKETDLPVSSL